MARSAFFTALSTAFVALGLPHHTGGAVARAAEGKPEVLLYHPIRTDKAGQIVPWLSDDLGRSYDHAIRKTWEFWDRMAPDRNGLPYHMNHQVWNETMDDHRGIGGDQIAMALSSWGLLYAYMGHTRNPGTPGQSRDRIVENMRFMADWYLSHSLSASTARWPNIPYPYNTLTYSGIYDGDMVIGAGYTQPDKAGSFGIELVSLWKITDNQRYLDAAVAIADTLAARTKPGDGERSPMPFKVHAATGEPGVLKEAAGEMKSVYTSNWVGTLQLFEALTAVATKPAGKSIDKRRVAAYRKAHDVILTWMKAYPLKTNKWGPFFEDIYGWSDTQINAVTFASYMMDHTAEFPAWKTQVRGILDWAWRELGNKEWERYGVTVVNEQTAYRVPGNSHTARQSAAELRYAELTGDASRKGNAIRGLSWATYMVDADGKNRYPRDDIWLTDGYGDYVRHYLRAMAAAPELAPTDADHILRSSTIVTRVQYGAASKPPAILTYSTWEVPSTEVIRLVAKPKRIVSMAKDSKDTDLVYPEVPDVAAAQGWSWQPLAKGGLLRVRHDSKKFVTIER